MYIYIFLKGKEESERFVKKKRKKRKKKEIRGIYIRVLGTRSTIELTTTTSRRRRLTLRHSVSSDYFHNEI
jgi:hypothetical protein